MKVFLTDRITLEKVDEQNLEALRNLRNDPSVNHFLASPATVSAEEQVAWFRKTDPLRNIYFLVFVNDEPAGYCMLKHIDDSRAAEPGIILTRRKLHYSSAGSLLTIAFLDFCHCFFGIVAFHGNVLHSNESALKNYDWFDTVVKAEDEKQKVLSAAMPYAEMPKVNKLRDALRKLENYTGKFRITANEQELQNLPQHYACEQVSIEIS